MKHIFHYPLPVDAGPFELKLPEGARFLHVGERQGRPVGWYLVDPARKAQKRRLYNAYTGLSHKDLAPMRYLGTVRTSWTLVFHYFEEDYNL